MRKLSRHQVLVLITYGILVYILSSYSQNIGVYIRQIKKVSDVVAPMGWAGTTVCNDDTTPYLIPRSLEKTDPLSLISIYWKYINSIQILCRNQTRLGSLKDGGKEVCLDELYKPKQPCIVYSFGSNFQFDFESDVVRMFSCEVHSFDPSMDINNATIEKIPKGVTFHQLGLGGEDTIIQAQKRSKRPWRIMTLLSSMKGLKHINSTIDILKIDVEGAEWMAIPQMIATGVLKRVKQLCIEIHFGLRGRPGQKKPWGDVDARNQLKGLRQLYEAGFRIFMREHNLFAITNVNGIGKLTKNNNPRLTKRLKSKMAAKMAANYTITYQNVASY